MKLPSAFPQATKTVISSVVPGPLFLVIIRQGVQVGIPWLGTAAGSANPLHIECLQSTHTKTCGSL